MANELLFFLHSLCMMVATLFTLRVGGQYGLTSFICVQWILANLLVTKQITLFGFDVTATDVFIVSAGLGLNVLQEHFGQQAARKAILASFNCSFFYVLITQFHLLYTPNMYDTAHPAFVQLFNHTPRIVVASLVTYVITQYLNINLFAFAKRYFGPTRFVSRIYFTEGITQLVDTIIFSFLGLYGIMANIWHIMLVSYVIKVVVIVVAGPFAALSKYVVQTKS